jgi:Domain of unknown function (DUF6894)
MPLYFFHLAFGDRISPDEEGVELPSRAAASREAIAVARDLSDPALGGDPRRWAGWFLEVADERGTVLRTPIGYPALEVAGKDPVRWKEEKPAAEQGRPVAQRDQPKARLHSAHHDEALAAVAGQIREQTSRAIQLLERSRQLRYELSCAFRTSESARLRANQLVAGARGLDVAPEVAAARHSGAKPPERARPRLVLLPGGR